MRKIGIFMVGFTITGLIIPVIYLGLKYDSNIFYYVLYGSMMAIFMLAGLTLLNK